MSFVNWEHIAKYQHWQLKHCNVLNYYNTVKYYQSNEICLISFTNCVFFSMRSVKTGSWNAWQDGWMLVCSAVEFFYSRMAFVHFVLHIVVICMLSVTFTIFQSQLTWLVSGVSTGRGTLSTFFASMCCTPKTLLCNNNLSI